MWNVCVCVCVCVCIISLSHKNGNLAMQDSKDDPEVTALTETQEDKRHRISLTCEISKHKKTCMDTEQTQDTENKQVVVKREEG